MSRKSGVHTVPNPDGAGWVNELNGRTVSHHRTQGTASERGREIAQEHHTEHLIHRPNGQIRERNSYGNDPFPPAG